MILQGALIVIQQIIIIFVLIAVGFLAAKFGILREEGARQITDLLLIIVIPCVIIMAFQASFERSLIKNLLIAALLAALTHAAGILISKLIFKSEAPDRRIKLAYSTIFYNAGFFSLPLLRALLGETGVLYGSVFVAVFNLFAWTYGIRLMNGGNGASKWKTFLNPGIISLLIALVLVLLNIRLPEIVQTTLRYITGLHTPLAMIIIGCQFYLMWRNFNLRDLALWKTVLARNILVPVPEADVTKLAPDRPRWHGADQVGSRWFEMAWPSWRLACHLDYFCGWHSFLKGRYHQVGSRGAEMARRGSSWLQIGRDGIAILGVRMPS